MKADKAGTAVVMDLDEMRVRLTEIARHGGSAAAAVAAIRQLRALEVEGRERLDAEFAAILPKQ